MPLTTTYANEYLNFLLAKTAALTAPSAVYIGLCTNDPEEDNGVIQELSGGGYSRVMVSQKNQTYPNLIGNAAARAISNPGQINWTKATQNWARVNGFFLSASSVVGETAQVFFYGALQLDDDVKDAGGLLVEAGAVALFDPQAFKIEFPARDSVG